MRSEDWAKTRRRVLAAKGRHCFWCGRKLVNISDITSSKRIKLKKHKIIWRGSRKIKEGWLATIDHVKPRSLGGTNDLSNLVVSCHECNNVRGRFSEPAFKKKAHRSRKQYILDSWTTRVREYWQLVHGEIDPWRWKGNPGQVA